MCSMFDGTSLQNRAGTREEWERSGQENRDEGQVRQDYPTFSADKKQSTRHPSLQIQP